MPDGAGSTAPGGAPRHLCGSCRAEQVTWDATCPACGAPLDAPRLPRRARRALAVAAAASVAAAAAYAAPRIDAARDRQAVAAARSAAASEAAERTRVARDQRPVAGRLAGTRDDLRHGARRRLGARRRMVTALEAVLRADATARYEAGTSDGPVRDAVCRPLLHTHGGPGDESDLSARTGRFECLASTLTIQAHGRAVGRVGQPYVAALHFRTGRYVLCKHHPAPGEGGVMLAQVPLDPSCFGARDRAHLAALGIRESPRD